MVANISTSPNQIKQNTCITLNSEHYPNYRGFPIMYHDRYTIPKYDITYLFFPDINEPFSIWKKVIQEFCQTFKYCTTWYDYISSYNTTI